MKTTLFYNLSYILKTLFCVLIFSYISALNAHAAVVNEIKPLSFGKIALKDNNASYVMQMTFAGQVTADPAIIIIESGHPAEYELSGFLQHSLLNISIIVPSNVTQLAGAFDPSTSQFSITNHHTFSPVVTTDALGEAIIHVGATLTTSGSGFYKDAKYFSHMTIMVDY